MCGIQGWVLLAFKEEGFMCWRGLAEFLGEVRRRRGVAALYWRREEEEIVADP